MTKPSINLNQMLYSLDVGAKDWYEKLDSEIKKTFSSYVAMRFASSIKASKILQETYIQNVNEFCNKDFSVLQKHQEDSLLFWKLLCLCGVGKKMFHPWIKAPKGKGKKTKRIEFLQSLYPNYKNDEIDLLSKILDKDAIKQLARDAGLDDKEIKLLK